MSKLIKLHHVYICDDEVGEVEGMFDAKGKLLDLWSNNDANWRGEYFEGFMNAIGFTVDDGDGVNPKLEKKLKAAAKKAWG